MTTADRAVVEFSKKTPTTPKLFYSPLTQHNFVFTKKKPINNGGQDENFSL